jgi:hypothetical protein
LPARPLVEGLHRRLPYEQSQFPAASGSGCGRIKKAAREAAAVRAEDETGMNPDLVRTAVHNAVCHFEDVGYRTRAQDITGQVTSAVPEPAESVPDLAGQLMQRATTSPIISCWTRRRNHSPTGSTDRWRSRT